MKETLEAVLGLIETRVVFEFLAWALIWLASAWLIETRVVFELQPLKLKSLTQARLIETRVVFEFVFWF